MKVINFRAYTKNSLRGFLDIELPSGMVLKDCTLHQKSDGDRWWVGLPAKEFKKADGTTGYANLIDFIDKETRYRFGDAATVVARAAFDAAAPAKSPTRPAARPAGGLESAIDSEVPF